jgi:thiosulfate sulfurtransferase
MMNIVSPSELHELLVTKPVTLLDIRDLESYSKAHIENAQHLDLNQMEQLYPTLDKEQPMVIYCYHGVSSQRAAHLFENLGFKEVYSLQGGYSLWAGVD